VHYTPVRTANHHSSLEPFVVVYRQLLGRTVEAERSDRVPDTDSIRYRKVAGASRVLPARDGERNGLSGLFILFVECLEYDRVAVTSACAMFPVDGALAHAQSDNNPFPCSSDIDTSRLL